MPAALSPVNLGSDRWVQVPATWDSYLALRRERGEKSRPRYTFFDGRLTIVSPGNPHEVLKKRLAFLIEETLTSLGIDFQPAGSVTLLTGLHPRTGTETDESYYLTNIDRVVGKTDLVMGEDPPPDLTVEDVVSHPERDAIEAYRGFGVREVWVVKETGLEFLVLGNDRRYEPSPTSSLLPFVESGELTTWVFRQDPGGDLPLRRQFRAWVEATLAPRLRH